MNKFGGKIEAEQYEEARRQIAKKSPKEDAYKVGDYVLIQQQQRPGKLGLSWKGPFLVVKRETPKSTEQSSSKQICVSFTLDN